MTITKHTTIILHDNIFSIKIKNADVIILSKISNLLINNHLIIFQKPTHYQFEYGVHDPPTKDSKTHWDQKKVIKSKALVL